MSDDHCLNCNAHVRTINYAMGAQLMHVDPHASFPTERKGTAWRYCKRQVATPDHAKPGETNGDDDE